VQKGSVKGTDNRENEGYCWEEKHKRGKNTGIVKSEAKRKRICRDPLGREHL